MARKGWEKDIAKVERPDDWGVQVISSSDVRTLLVRQHAAFVRSVKNLCRRSDREKRPFDELNIAVGYRYACADILAMLGEGK